MAKKLNLPNTLSLLRVVLTPLFMLAAILLQDAPIWCRIFPALLFLAAAITDLLDGMIARKQGIVTDFGKFIDPLADKFMIFAACITLLVIEPAIAPVFVWVSAVVMLRELAVTSLRLVVAGKSGIVVAASFFGKCKTVTQVVAVMIMFLEPTLAWLCSLVSLDPLVTFFGNHIFSYIGMGAMALTTVASGLDYMKSYLPYIDPHK